MADLFTNVGTLSAVLLTIFVYSYLIKDNPLYRFAEHTAVGFGAAYSLVVAKDRIVDLVWKPLSAGKFVTLIPVLAGILFYTRMSRKYSWLSRYAFALLIGVTSGYTVRVIPVTEFVVQVQATMLPLFVSGDSVATISNIILVTGSFAAFFFFIMSRLPAKGTPIVQGVRNYGRWIIMIAMGSQYGNTVFARLTYIIGRMAFILKALGIG